MRSAFVACLASLLLAGVASAESVSGQYVEVRNAAMWAGPCLYNSEMGVSGDKATLAWKITKGQYADVSLDGLAVVAIVFGNRTFGMGDEVTTKTVFIVDDRADKAQQTALMNLAKELAGPTIQEVIDVKRSNIEMEVADDGSAYSSVDAGITRIRTRRLRRSDNLCGTDQRRMVYPALAKITNEQAAYTLENSYTVRHVDLNMRKFEDRNAPTAVIGDFAL